MRDRALLALFASISLLYGAPALAQESDPVFTGSVGTSISSEWLYVDQGFNQTEDTDAPFSTVDATLCHRSTCLSAWYGEAEDANELDLTLSQGGIEAGGFTIDVQGGIFIVDGPEIWEAKISASRPFLCDSCRVSASYEVMRGGFIEDVLKVELTDEGELSENIGYDVAVGIAHSRWADGFAVPFEAGLSTEILENVSGRLFVKGYLSDEPRVTVGFALSSEF